MLETRKKSVKAGKFVDTEHVNATIGNYKQERWVQNSKRLGMEDSLSVWYSIEELEEFLATCKEHGADGVRMYFGAYDKAHAPKEEYAGRQTVVLVASKDKETFGGRTTKDVYIPTTTGTTILAYNVGRLCPPMCSTGPGFKALGTIIVDKGKDGMVIA